MRAGLIGAGLCLGLALGVGLYGAGWRQGAASCRAKAAQASAALSQRLQSLAEATQLAERARIDAARARDRLARQLEEEAYADPDAARPAFGADSLRRLQRQ